MANITILFMFLSIFIKEMTKNLSNVKKINYGSMIGFVIYQIYGTLIS